MFLFLFPAAIFVLLSTFQENSRGVSRYAMETWGIPPGPSICRKRVAAWEGNSVCGPNVVQYDRLLLCKEGRMRNDRE